jgi:hypothetical protein
MSHASLRESLSNLSGRPDNPRARCKPRSTPFIATLCLVVAAVAVACGGSPSKQSYKKAVSKQESCCGQLGDPAAREACLSGIVRVDDPAVQSSDANLATYACIERHFACDRTTGRATQPSAQAQLDCINDL